MTHESLPMISRNVRTSIQTLGVENQSQKLILKPKINVELRIKYGIIPKKKTRKLETINDYANNTIKDDDTVVT
jgi:hypothetical protein